MTTFAREQTARLAELLQREHSAMADFLLALATFDRERGWEQLGYPSLFSFLRRELRLSAGAAQYRKTAAELVQRFPEIEAALRGGDLCLSSIIELGKIVTPENVSDILPRFFGLSSRDAAAVAISIRPLQAPPMRELVTSVARAAVHADAGAVSGPLEASSLESVRAPEASCPGDTPATVSPSAPLAKVTPLTAELRRLNLTVSRRLLDKLEAARAALSHSHPGASMDQILELGLDLILERHAKRRGLVKNPRPPKAKPVPVPSMDLSTNATVAPTAPRCRDCAPASASRKRQPIRAAVKRAVWQRDGGRCQWPVHGGGVCGSTLRVELDHVIPVALGGRSTIENLRCLCAAHNRLAARRVFGDGHMDLFTRRAPRSPA